MKQKVINYDYCQYPFKRGTSMPNESTIAPENKTTMSVKMPAQWKKPCYYFWICDCSESMGLKNRSNNLVKMDEINKAIPQAIEKIRDFQKNNQKGQITMRTIKFSDTAEWVDKDSIPVDQYMWKDLSADGITSLGAAFSKVAQALKTIEDGGTMPQKAYPPVLVLITDGYPTDEWNKGFDELMSQFWAQKAVRIAIALEGADDEILRAFIGDVDNADKKLVRINDSDLPELAENITLATTIYGNPYERKMKAEKYPPEHTQEEEVNKIIEPVSEVVIGPIEDFDHPSETEISSPSPDTSGTTDANSPESPEKEDIPQLHEEIIF
ncbi:MAG: VWA domain-containing protein [Methanomicrobiales archaeon]